MAPAVGWTLPQVLDDLQCRFIINVPKDELATVERVCFQIEQAHWFYEDFMREASPSLPSFSLRQFCHRIFSHCPILRQGLRVEKSGTSQPLEDIDFDKAFDTFIEYKVRVPVCGAVILNESLTKALLVRGWKSSAGWGFPKGKINKEESEAECAAREVLEETGFDITGKMHGTFIERTIREQRIRLYIVPGVPESTSFLTQTRKEIGDIKWFKLADLPGFQQESEGAPPAMGPNGLPKTRFYMVTAFAGALRRWITTNKKSSVVQNYATEVNISSRLSPSSSSSNLNKFRQRA
ncbi:Dcp2, box A domain-containing protein [Zopfochytrium polystomum]|nr:Dcp2, box A domain-containing protein [Zopfochytrium polystomum]